MSAADIEAIRQLKARYFRTLDQKDWSGYRQVFADDVEIDVTDDAADGDIAQLGMLPETFPGMYIRQVYLNKRNFHGQ